MWTSGWPYSWIGILNAAFWTATIIIVARRMRTYSGALGALTVPDFLGQRYDSNFLRIWTCIGCTIFYILLIVSQYKGAIALFSTLFGMDKTVIIVAFSLFAIILVNIGGFKSVAWTDFLQGILMVIIQPFRRHRHAVLSVCFAGGQSLLHHPPDGHDRCGPQEL